MALSHPDAFAALVVVAGGGDPAKLSGIANIPSWSFHAASDPVVAVKFGRDTVDALSAAGAKPKYTEYPSEGYFYPSAHFSWVPAYADESMREWLFALAK